MTATAQAYDYEAVTVCQLRVGDTVLFDPIYGVERVEALGQFQLPNRAQVMELTVRTYPFVRTVTEYGPRNIVRAVHEQVLRHRP